MSLFDERLDFYMHTKMYDEYEEWSYEQEEKRNRFITLFPANQIMAMEIDDYVVGKKNDDGSESFCYWLETKLMELGKIKGGTTADKKFGVYFGSRKNDDERKYRTIHKWNEDFDPHAAFITIKEEIAKLLESGKKGDYDAVHLNRISPMFKGKILSTYYPEQYLPIFSEDHLKYFMDVLPIEFDMSNKYRIIDRQNILLDFKRSNKETRRWNNIQFTKFLYNMYDPRDEMVESTIPDVEYVNFSYGDKIKTTKGVNKVKVDYEKANKAKARVGQRGERIVFTSEKERLVKSGRDDLAKKVKMASLEDDSLGYDILSFDIDGNKKFIEVKSTALSPNKIDFYISENELKITLREENHYVYLVYEVDSKKPQIHILDKTILNDEYLEPVSYRVRLRIKKN